MEKKIDKGFFLTCCYSYFINGLIVLMTGSILTYLMADYDLSFNQVGLLVSMQAMGNLLTGLFSGVIIHFLGRKKAMLSISILFTVGFGGIIFTSSPYVLFALLFLTGAGWAINNNLINVLVSEGTGGDSGYSNILHMSFAIGAFISPLMISAFSAWGINWRVAVGLVSLGAASLILVFLRLPVEEVETVEDDQQSGMKLSFDFLKDPKYFLYMAIFFCYVGAEIGLNSWLITYLVQQGLMEIDKAPLMLSALWVAIIFGRIVVAYISKFIRKDLLLAGISISMFVFIALFLLNKDPKYTFILMVAIGLSMAGIYPTTVANASYILTGAGLASGVLFAGGGLGASVVPYIAGAIAENNGILAGLISTLVVVFILVVLSLVNVVASKKERTR